MSRVKHNAVHQFAAGVNAASSNNPASSVPFIHPTQQGWKVYYEPLSKGATYADDAFYEITAVTTGTLTPGDSNSLKFAAKMHFLFLKVN